MATSWNLAARKVVNKQAWSLVGTVKVQLTNCRRFQASFLLREYFIFISEQAVGWFGTWSLSYMCYSQALKKEEVTLVMTLSREIQNWCFTIYTCRRDKVKRYINFLCVNGMHSAKARVASLHYEQAYYIYSCVEVFLCGLQIIHSFLCIKPSASSFCCQSEWHRIERSVIHLRFYIKQFMILLMLYFTTVSVTGLIFSCWLSQNTCLI